MENQPRLGALKHFQPTVHPSAHLLPGVIVVGDVRIGPLASVWYGSVLRADSERIEIGEACNIQDQCCLHADPGEPTVLGDRVTIGHRAVVHGATVRHGALVGIGAVILGGADVGKSALVAAGAVVTPGTRIPPFSLAAGVPAKVVRPLTEVERKTVAERPDEYLALSERHREVGWAF